MSRCTAVFVGVGRCNFKEGHQGLHEAGDSSGYRMFTTEEGEQSLKLAQARSELGGAWQHLTCLANGYKRGDSTTPERLHAAVDRLVAARTQLRAVANELKAKPGESGR